MSYIKLTNQTICIVVGFLYFNTAFSNTVETKEKDVPEVIKEIPLEVISQDNVSKSGDVVTFTLSKPTKKNFSVYLGQTQVICIEQQNSLRIVAGVDINTLFGNYLLSARTKKEQILQIPFQVKPFSPQYLDSPPDMNGVELASSDEVIKSLLWSNREPKLPLTFPANGNWSDDFGAYFSPGSDETKIQNNRLQKVDNIRLAISTPTVIRSPGKAVIFAVYFDEQTGYRVLLDHGMGLFSEISGLPNISVEEQEIVTQGTLIANVTASDFVKNKIPQKQTVLWRVFLTKALVNPRSLIR